MNHERLMGLRALSQTILPPPGLALAAMPAMPKSGAALRLMPNDYDDSDLPTDTDSELPDTIPPPAGEAPSVIPSDRISGMSTVEEIAFNEDPENWTGYDESKWLHRTTKALVTGTNELLRARQTWDIEAIIKRQTILFTDALKPQFDALATRLDRDIGELRSELAAMRTRMSEIEVALGLRTK